MKYSLWTITKNEMGKWSTREPIDLLDHEDARIFGQDIFDERGVEVEIVDDHGRTVEIIGAGEVQRV